MTTQPEQYIFANEHLRATLVRREEALWFSLTELAGGKQWGEVPLMKLEIHDKMQRRMDVVTRYRIDAVETVDGGVHITLGDNFHQVRVGLWLRLREGELSVFLQPMEIYEDSPALYRLFAIDLFPGLMHTDASGSLLLPITSGMRCYPADKPQITDRFLIYGQQERWELLPTLPFCAVDAPDGGLMALATQGAADAECRVATDGRGNGEVSLGFSFRQYWPDPVDFDNREIRMIPIPAGARADIFSAKRIRRHTMEDLGKATLRQRVDESPEVAYVLGAYIMKMFYGIENEGIMMYGQKSGNRQSFQRVMTFADGRRHLQQLHDAGIDKILTEGVGWNPRGHDGMYPTRLPPDERLGGEEGFRELLAFGNALGYYMSVHDNYIDSYQVSPVWDADTTIYDMFGEPLVSGLWGGGINYRQWPLTFSYDRLEGQMRKLQELGVRGMYYCDGMGNPLEVNYHPKHRGPRSHHAKGICRILETARNVTGSSGTECGFLYCVLPVDCIAMMGWGWNLRRMKPEWAVTALCDQQLPIWHLALHDLVMHEGHGLKWSDVMRKVLFGSHPRTEWSTLPGIMDVLDEAMIRALHADYVLTLGRFGYLQLQEMVDYQEPENGVAISRFADGTEVIADFTRGELTVNGERIPCPAGITDDTTVPA